MPTTKATVTKKVVSKKAQTPKKAITHTPAQKKVGATKKPVVKKAVAKKSLTPKSKKTAPKQKPLVVADDARSFWVADGKILNSLVALQSALEEMEAAVYAHHVTHEKNDFAQWVGDVLCDKTCASALSKAKTTTAAKTVVVRHLKSYQL